MFIILKKIYKIRQETAHRLFLVEWGTIKNQNFGKSPKKVGEYYWFFFTANELVPAITERDGWLCRIATVRVHNYYTVILWCSGDQGRCSFQGP